MVDFLSTFGVLVSTLVLLVFIGEGQRFTGYKEGELMLEFVDFSLKFKDKDKLVTVVKNLNFKVEKERFALVGESGSGKVLPL